jgi:hypothetical protein
MKVPILAFVEFSSVVWGSHSWATLTGYGHAVSAYWWAILAGMAVLFVDVLKWRGTESKVPTWVKITLAISAFSVAQFLAYRDSMLDFERVRHEKRDAIGERGKLQAEVQRQQAKLEDKDNLIQSQQNLINKKIVSSLGSRMAMPYRASGQRAVTGNRLLDDKRKNILVAMLQSIPAVAEIHEPVNNEEAAARGSELIEILGEAGWGLRRIKWVIPEGVVPSGIVIRSGANNVAMASQLEKALSEVGLPARWEKQVGSNDWIEVYVGQKP